MKPNKQTNVARNGWDAERELLCNGGVRYKYDFTLFGFKDHRTQDGGRATPEMGAHVWYSEYDGDDNKLPEERWRCGLHGFFNWDLANILHATYDTAEEAMIALEGEIIRHYTKFVDEIQDKMINQGDHYRFDSRNGHLIEIHLDENNKSIKNNSGRGMENQK